jgi:hypothetical protein
MRCAGVLEMQQSKKHTIAAKHFKRIIVGKIW